MLNELAKIIHANAVDKGFWEKPVETGTYLMFIVSELGEALEADRKSWRTLAHNIDKVEDEEGDFQENFRLFVKDTFEDELADALIRILDLAAGMNIDIQKHVELKMRYNATRDKKHGKNY